ncbi:MAG: glycosyltransferase family 4 protein [Clostridia bacterium]|nr:glycosyltransferase family 4 protein [Clostridia bacterium]
MQICVDTRGAKIYAGTGIGTYTARLMENIMSIDDSNSYTFFWPNDGYDFMLDKKNVSVTLFGEKNKRFWDESYLPALVSRRSFNVFHLPQNGLGLPKQKSCPYVVTVHDLIPYTMPETCGKSYLDRFVEQMPRILENADRIITVSEYSKQDIIRFFNTPAEKIRVTHLAADSGFKLMDKEKAWSFLKDKYNYTGDYILYLGGFSPRKNVDGLIEAYRKIYKELPGHYDLMLLGASKDNHYELRKKIDSLGLSDRVVFAGFVPYEHLPYFYNCASVFTYPSFYEGFGLPPLEAMTCGTPTITSNVTSIPEIVEDAAITIDPNSINQLTESMYNVLTDMSLRKSMIEKGLRRAYNFSWKKTAIETIKVYEELQ